MQELRGGNRALCHACAAQEVETPTTCNRSKRDQCVDQCLFQVKISNTNQTLSHGPSDECETSRILSESYKAYITTDFQKSPSTNLILWRRLAA